MNRAERRAQAERIKRRVRRLAVCYAPDDPRVVGQLARTRKPCSCWFCAHKNRPPQKYALDALPVMEAAEWWAGIAGRVRTPYPYTLLRRGDWEPIDDPWECGS